jgi:translation elongation factor EF-Ts
MIFKEIVHNYKEADHEEVPSEEIWEDGELNSKQVEQKIIDNVMHIGEWILIRRIKQ